MTASLILSGLLGTASACPAVATGTPNELTYDVAKTAIVRQGNKSTFTVSINPEGASQSFALVMPVPGDLIAEDLGIVDVEVFTRLDGQTGLLTMEDAGCWPPHDGYESPCWRDDYASEASGSDDGSGGSDHGSYGDVEVEAEYVVGSYEIAVLSATESADLFRWLNDNGYYVAGSAIPVMQDYLDEGMYFLAARVSEEAEGADGSALTPLKIAYESEIFAIPIKLAAASSPGQQDMIIYAVTDADKGQVGISNYTELGVDDACIWNFEDEAAEFSAFYEERFNTAWQGAGDAGWQVEWAGVNWDCNPCSGFQITPDDLSALGFEGTDHALTRLHVRYTQETANQDLVLYESMRQDSVVTSYANDAGNNRWCIDACDPADQPALDTWRADTQAEREAAAQAQMEAEAEECAEDTWDLLLDPVTTTSLGESDSSTGGCSVTAGTAGAAAVGFALLAVAWRRDD